MCIRDRCSSEESFVVAQQLFGERRRLGVDRGIERQIVVRPVSYTHLRAHETVLDLVCRLLLEKKKQTTRTQGLTIYK